MSEAPIPFAKLQAADNVYLAVDGRAGERDWSALARAMAKPHFGVGSDGLVVAQTSTRAAVRMRVFNSDGSEAEMSGNGLRLFAKFVLDRSIVREGADGLQVETGGGIRTVWPSVEGGRMVAGRIAMGQPIFDPARIPLASEASAEARRVLELPLRALGRSLSVTCLSIGNPHAVCLLDEPVESFPLEEVGPAVQGHTWFPNRINFEIVNVLDRGRLRARIFERGEGETLSSGTGSTAAAVAARLHGRTGDRVEVLLRGGVLEVAWPGTGEAFLSGPVEEIFEGVWQG